MTPNHFTCKLIIALALTSYIFTARAGLTEDEKRAELELKNSELQQLEPGHQSDTNASQLQSIEKQGLTARSVPVGCVSNPFPASPGSPSYSLTAEWAPGETTALTVWRQPCANNPEKSAVFLRAIPSNEPFICSSSFTVIQNGIQYDSAKLTNTIKGSSFCGDLFVPSTFLLDQWSIYTNFDENRAFTLVYEGVYKNTRVSIPAYTPSPPSNVSTVISLAVPANNKTYSGVGVVQGWAVSPDGIDRIELFVDGKYWTNAPYGGLRTDVGNKYPNIAGSKFSGYVMPYNYNSLSIGKHTLTARTYSRKGAVKEASSSFRVQKFHKNAFAPSAINVSQAQCALDQSGALFSNMAVGGQLYNVRLQWQTATQGFEITSIKQ